MAMTDPLGDMLTRIRNGQQAQQGFDPDAGVEAARPRARCASARRLYPRLFRRSSWPARRACASSSNISRASRRSSIWRACRSPAAGSIRARASCRASATASARSSCRPRAACSVGRRGARAECRRRSAGGGVLMSRIGKRAGAAACGRVGHHRRPDPVGQGSQGHAAACRCATRSPTRSATTASS